MEDELEHYYRQSSPAKQTLDRKLKPIVVKIQSHNINSIHQFEPDPEMHGQMSKTTAIFSRNNHSPLKKFYSIREYSPNRNVGASTSLRRRPNATLSPNRFNDDKERVLFVNPVSKVKRHLIDNIDFQSMETVLYKKASRTSRIDHFYKTLMQKEHSEGKQLPTEKSQISRVRDSPFEDGRQRNSKQNDKDDATNENIFKITQKKKFWRQGKWTQNIEETESHLLLVRGLSQNDN